MAGRDYSTGAITVHWDSALCIHTAICLRGNPRVFDNRRRPWVDVTADEADAIAETVRRCPTGALTYQRHDAGEPEHDDDVSMTVVPGGRCTSAERSHSRTPTGPRSPRSCVAPCAAAARRPTPRSATAATGRSTALDPTPVAPARHRAERSRSARIGWRAPDE